MIKITSVRMKKSRYGDEKTLATASVQFDECLIVHGIKILQLGDKRVVSFPSKRIKKYMANDGEYTSSFTYADIVHPSNNEFREYVEKVLLDIYDNDEGGYVDE